MANTQEMNWGVTTDKFDRLFKTRLVYVGTEKEIKDTQRRIKRLDKRRRRNEPLRLKSNLDNSL